MKSSTRLAGVIKSHEKEILADWIKEQLASTTLRGDLLKESERREQLRAFLAAVQAAAQKGSSEDIAGPAWVDVKQLLAELSRARSLAGFSPSETATFVLSLKQPLFSRMTAELKSNAAELGEELWSITLLLDKLGLQTIELYLKSRESVID